MALRNIILSVKRPASTAEFLSKVLGMSVFYEGSGTIELRRSVGKFTPIIIKEANNAAALSVGYTPILNFDVRNLEEAVQAGLEMGAMLDGSIKHKSFGKVAAIRSPDGHTIGLFEPVIELD